MGDRVKGAKPQGPSVFERLYVARRKATPKSADPARKAHDARRTKTEPVLGRLQQLDNHHLLERVLGYVKRERPALGKPSTWKELHQGDLASCMRVCSRFNRIVGPLLYAEPVVDDVYTFTFGFVPHSHPITDAWIDHDIAESGHPSASRAVPDRFSAPARLVSRLSYTKRQCLGMVERLFLELPDLGLTVPVSGSVKRSWDTIRTCKPTTYDGYIPGSSREEWTRGHYVMWARSDTTCRSRQDTITNRSVGRSGLVRMRHVVLDAFAIDKDEADDLFDKVVVAKTREPKLTRANAKLFCRLLRRLSALRHRHMFLVHAPCRPDVSLCVSAAWEDLQWCLDKREIPVPISTVGEYHIRDVHYHLDSLLPCEKMTNLNAARTALPLADQTILHYLKSTMNAGNGRSHVIRQNTTPRGADIPEVDDTVRASLGVWTCNQAFARAVVHTLDAPKWKHVRVLAIPPVTLDLRDEGTDRTAESRSGVVRLVADSEVPAEHWERWRQPDNQPSRRVEILVPQTGDRCPACHDPLFTPVIVHVPTRDELFEHADAYDAT